MKLALLGGGRMGGALLGGLLEAGWEPDEIAVAEADADRRRILEKRHPEVRIVPSAASAVGEVDVVVVAVKPAEVVTVLRQAGEQLPDAAVVISIAAGVTIATLEGSTPGHPVVRAMPNMPALVHRGAAAIAGGSRASDADLDLAARILGSVGVVVQVEEPMLDAVTGLSGSGPAYVFLVGEALIEAGVLAGLPRDTATTLATQTMLGAATMLAEGDEDAETLRAAVTSPGGTTAAGLAQLEAKGVRTAILDAVHAGTERSRELGRGQ